MLTPNNNFHALLFRLTRSSSRYLSISFGTRVPNWSKRLETGVGDKVSGHRVRVKLAMMWTETRLLDYAANESLQYHFLSKAITSGPRVAINIYKHFFSRELSNFKRGRRRNKSVFLLLKSTRSKYSQNIQKATLWYFTIRNLDVWVE